MHSIVELNFQDLFLRKS